MTFRSWEDMSRTGYGQSAEGNTEPQVRVEFVVAGALQRIANSLESLVALLDPARRKKREEQAARMAAEQARFRERQRWLREVYLPASEELRRRLDAALLRFRDGRTSNEVWGTVGRRASLAVLGPTAGEDRADARTLRERLEAFRPLDEAFWERVRLTRRGREAVLGALRHAGAAPATPAYERETGTLGPVHDPSVPNQPAEEDDQ
jgi:hypothetical protein